MPLVLAVLLKAVKRHTGRVIAFGLRHWRELLIGVLLCTCWQQRREIRHQDAAIVAIFEAHRQAAAASQLRAAETGQEAVQAHVERIEQDRPVVERVVTRLRNVCLRQPAADRDLPMPAGAAPADDAARAAGDDADRAFTDAAGRDLARCSAELSRLSGLQNWVHANGGAPTEPPPAPDAGPTP